MLELKNVAFKLDDGKEILKDITLTVPDGGLIVVTGPNGGGKTTLAKVIAGLEHPTNGSIFFDGEDITDMDITSRAKKGISFAFQQPVRFKGINVRTLLDMAAGRRLSESELCHLLGKVGLCTYDYIDREVDASLSGGEIKRIEIATVLARNTKLSIFDEPEAGIDLWSFTGLIKVFRELKNSMEGSLLIISHQERILEIADKIIVIADGTVRKYGTRDEVLPSLLSNEKASNCPVEGGPVNE